MHDLPSPILLLTGLSGAGKTTIARAVSEQLRANRIRVQVLDGDELRSTLCKDLDFSCWSRQENVARIFWVAGLLSSHGILVLIAAIAPFREQRNAFRKNSSHVAEVYVKAPINVCAERDPKGLYAAASAGTLKFFTGVDSPYEEPDGPDLVCHTSGEQIEESTAKVMQLLHRMLEGTTSKA